MRLERKSDSYFYLISLSTVQCMIVEWLAGAVGGRVVVRWWGRMELSSRVVVVSVG
jgi:hypothetical protein